MEFGSLISADIAFLLLVSVFFLFRPAWLLLMALLFRFKTVAICRRFGIGSLLGCLLPVALLGVLIFFVCCGWAGQYSHLIAGLQPGIDGWLRACLLDAGYNIGSAEEFLRLKIFLALFIALVWAIPFSYVFVAFSNSLDNFFYNSRFLVFPFSFFFQLKGKLWRHWGELQSFQMHAEDNNEFAGFLVLKFADGAQLKLPRKAIRNEHFDGLLRFVARRKPDAIDVSFSDGITLNMDAVFEDEKLQSTRLGCTQLWEQEFERLQATTFVPHCHGDSLQDGKYIVHEMLSSSALAATYIGMSAMGERVLIKEAVLPAGHSEAIKFREMYQRECLHLSKLKHPRIAAILDAFVEDGRNYLLIEYIEGADLESVRLSRKIEPSIALEWVIQVCEILEYLHGQEPPVLHRDITPHNLILTSANELYLIDFGAAKTFQENVTGTLIGKQCYIAPEVLRGRATVQSDIYSLGAVLFTLLTGSEPEALSICSIREKDPTLSVQFNDFVEHCTQLDEGKRFFSASQVKEEAIRLLALAKEGKEGNHIMKLKRQAEKMEALKVVEEGG